MDETRTSPKGGLATPRSRGALSGLLLLALGVWGALIPFVGPYFDYAYTPDTTWTWNTSRLLLEVTPGAAAAVGGLLLMLAGNRLIATLGGVLGVLAGSWFVVGILVAPLIGGLDGPGTPVGGRTSVAVEQIGFFYGLGAAMLLVGAFAVGRFSVVSVRDVGVAERRREERAAGDEAVPARDLFAAPETTAPPADDELRNEGRTEPAAASAPAPARTMTLPDVEPEGTGDMHEVERSQKAASGRRR